MKSFFLLWLERSFEYQLKWILYMLYSPIQDHFGYTPTHDLKVCGDDSNVLKLFEYCFIERNDADVLP